MSTVRQATGDYSFIEIEIPDTYTDDEGVVRYRPSTDVAEEAQRLASMLSGQNTRSTPPPQQEPLRPEFRRPQQPQRAQGATDERLSHSWGDCPNCHAPTKPSILKYQEWEDDGEGNEVPAKHFCPNDDCPTKSLWRRELEATPF